ncbi:Aliphatic amidase expression-regulating protein [Hartmannibacter diazotrophicus]|uniref:Aliphatic amidase expression-regulating protein n=1 Tax=Hartmannibacter diazotrophicus TaxID=1482074 RepID=A0A2C9D0P7_9HYPH|nr:transporter substrate-binding protein [Hartmannibacter diazotrophicus]SON53769.1 Aliphatic amidase expression-regulating protein [Hartmannibacter diazotrophicus]
MMRETIPVAILFSSTGPYADLGKAALAGAMAAIGDVNTDAGFPFRLKPVLAEPGGVAEAYGLHADQILRQTGCRHIVGTITSWSRKEVIPVVERHGALLWYAFPYEGYETNDSVLYFGACPNQHLLPLLNHVMPRYGSRPFLVGSDYIWGWEINRIARELIETTGGAVAGERYLPLGSTDVDGLIGEIRAARPDFVLSNLIGPSARAFVEAYAELGRTDRSFAPARRPIASCNMTEIDLAAIGPAAAGHLSTAIYFDGLPTSESIDFLAQFAARQGQFPRLSSCHVSAYSVVTILAHAIAAAGTPDPDAVRRIVTTRSFDSPLGPVTVDPATQHAAVRPHLGRARANGTFEIIESGSSAIPADPYLVGIASRLMQPAPASNTALRVVK